jgi:hypothetical protein
MCVCNYVFLFTFLGGSCFGLPMYRTRLQFFRGAPLPCRKLYKSCSFAVVQTAYRVQNCTRVQRDGGLGLGGHGIGKSRLCSSAGQRDRNIPRLSSCVLRYSRERESAVTGRQQQRPDRGTGPRHRHFFLVGCQKKRMFR